MLDRRTAGALARGTLATLLFFGVGEGLVRGVYALRALGVDEVALPYVLGEEYGPTPPWLDGLRILEPDPERIWRGRPHVHRRYVDAFRPMPSEENMRALLHRFLPRPPAELADSTSWEIALNSEGFREQELPTGKNGALRIACLGDSWTFGANVANEDSYPRRLEALLRAEHPRSDVEVLNLGVLGYTTFQGLRLLESRALALEPDVVLIGYAMNDRRVQGFRDRDLVGPQPLLDRVRRVLQHSELLRLLEYAVAVARYQPKPLDRRLLDESGTVPTNYEDWEPWLRVAPGDYEANLSRMLERVRAHGARPVLLYNEVDQANPYRTRLVRLARATGTPLVDSSELLARLRRRVEAGIAARHELHAPGCDGAGANGKPDVVIRATGGSAPVPRALFIAGNTPALGAARPNHIALVDDGTNGDERAGDGVWSLAVPLPTGTRVSYVYTNSGRHDRWEGLDVPALREFRLDARPRCGRVYRPVETFGEIYGMADAYHPNPRGYDAIARAVLQALRAMPEVGERLAHGERLAKGKRLAKSR